LAVILGIAFVWSMPAEAQGPVAAYAFNEATGTTTLDASGNGNVGTLSNGAVFAAGKNGNALSLDGVNDFVNLGNGASLQLTGSTTISAWINAAGFPGDDAVVVSKRTSSPLGLQLDTTVDRGVRTVGFKLTSASGANMFRYGTSVLQVNTWYHVAGVYNASAQTLTVYVNGQLDNGVLVGTVTTTQQNSNQSVHVGQRPGLPGTNNFNGRIDDVRIYSRALSQAEIQADMGTPVGGTPPANTPPTITAIGDRVTAEDTATGAISFTVGDTETPAGSLTVSGSSSNGTLVPNGNVVFGGSGASRTVTVTPAANQNGVTTITVTVSDGQASRSTSFQLTVTAVNDGPTLTGFSNQTTTAGTGVGPLSFTVADVETPAASLTVSGSSSNPTLVPNGNIVFGGSGGSRTLTVTPAGSQTGTATITVTVSDGQLSTSTGFQLTVTAVPTGLTAGYAFNEATGTTTLDASGNGNTGTLTNGATFTAGKNGNAVSLDGANDFVNLGTGASLQLTGSMTVSGWINATGFPTDDAVVVSKRNSGPLGFQLDTTVDRGTRTVGFKLTSATGGNMFRYGTTVLQVNTWYHVAGVYNASAQTLTVYVNGQPENGALVGTVTGSQQNSTLAAQVGQRPGVPGTYNFRGRIDDVRIYSRALSQTEIQADMGTPVGGTPPPNTPPTITAIGAQVTAEDTATGAISFTVGDAETPAGSLTVSGTSSNTTLVPNGSLVFGGSGGSRTVTVTPAANQNGVTTITVVVSDGLASTSTSFQLTVTAVNDAPTITGIGNQTTTAGTAVGPLSFTVGDVETPAGSLTVSRSSSNQTLVPDGNIVFGGSGASRTVTVTPAGSQTGTATITVTVSDGQLSTSTGFQLTVTTVPTGLVAAYAFNEASGTTTLDASGNGNTGTLTNGATFTAGKNGNAVSLDGTNDFVNLGTGASLQLTGSMTISAWINAAGFPVDDAVVVSRRTGGESGFQLDTTVDQGPRTVGFKLTSATGASMFRYGASALQVNTWYHMAGVYNASAQTLTVYVNGQPDNGVLLGAVTGTQQNPAQSVHVGQRPGVPGTYNFRGRIDDVRIYARALSQAEIQADMASGVSTGPSDTTPPTVAITAPTAGSNVFGLVSVVAEASDNVGIAGVQFRLDGQPLGAEVTQSPYSVAWNTASASQGAHTLTAVARDFAGNTKTSASISVTVASATPDRVGQWAAPVSWPLVAVHAHLLPTGEVLASSGQDLGATARVWNPTTNTFTSVNVSTGTNIFCSGHCHLADGRIIVGGGHNATHVGLTDTNIYDPVSRQWTRVASMHTPRWYPTLTTLGNGRILVTAGEINCDGCNALFPEVYDPATNTWTELSSASASFPYYPHMFVLPDGRVLAASTTEESIVTRALDVATQTWSVVDPLPVDGGSAAMFLPGKVIKSGTSTNPDDPVVPAAPTTYVLDTTQPTPTWRQTASMALARSFHTLTVLPDGNVLATGGGPTTDAIGLSSAIKEAELWSPVTETWTTMAKMQTPRLYHSTALLLPDGRVLVAGGGRWTGATPDPSDQLSAEIYSPPYLFKGARPVITSAPAQAGYGSTITIQTPDAARIASVALIKLGSVTHNFNMDQRFVPLSFTFGGGSVSAQAPPSGNIAPPGHYMLFIVDTSGIPSVATIVKMQ
jgi:hypothetical protein